MAKGSNFERESATRLSLWFSEGIADDWFWRTDASGGRATVRRRAGKHAEDQFGDLVAVVEQARPLSKRWCVECKTGYGSRLKDKKKITRWCVLDVLDSHQKEPVILAFWRQCLRDAQLSNREPVLIFRRNLMTACICFSREYCTRELVPLFGRPEFDHILMHLDCPDGDFFILPWEAFCQWASSEALFNWKQLMGDSKKRSLIS